MFGEWATHEQPTDFVFGTVKNSPGFVGIVTR